jgi:DNA-binding CsgD family transcriptional regulator
MDLLDIINKRTNPGIAVFNADERLVFVNNEVLETLASSNNVAENLKELFKLAKSNNYKSFLIYYSEIPYSVRALPLGEDIKSPSHIMLLIERIAEKHDIDIDRAKKRYGLSKREIEIVRLISEGLTNKEIAERLFISESTVKDHIKNIMKKMGTRSRNEIIALLK